MSGVRNIVTNNQAKRISLDAFTAVFCNDIKVVPASGVEPERLAAGDFKSPTYPMQNKDLG
jgi:hypothetical protein